MFNIDVAPSSRLYDASPTDDPRLPSPSPQLYAYQLPRIQRRDASRFRPATDHTPAQGHSVPPVEYLPGGDQEPVENDARREIYRLPHGRFDDAQGRIELIDFEAALPESVMVFRWDDPEDPELTPDDAQAAIPRAA